ncbi:MAG: sulfate permease, partial [SAR324 cluster bacterium]|nr:sulfate permease [SAR324 cluster bacterium]
PVIAASGLIFGVILLLFAYTGLIDWLAKFFTKSIVRGIQLGLGLILITKGIDYIGTPALFIQEPDSTLNLMGIPLNPVIGIGGGIITLLLLSSRRFPASLVIVSGGIIIGFLSGSLSEINFVLGPSSIEFISPGWGDFYTAAILLVIPQIPLTLGNAIISTSDTCISLFGDNNTTRRVSYRALAASMGWINLLTSGITGMPMCHGAGGLAAHHRFGARNGGSNLMIGVVFLVIALVFGTIGISLLMLIPNAVLGILLLFAGLELSLLIRDLTEKNDLMVTLLIASVGFATTNMGLAFLIGILIHFLMKRAKIKL